MEPVAGPVEGDAFGQALMARQEGRSTEIMIERDDGLVNVDPSDYFSPPEGPLWEWILARTGGRVLDIGAGAARAALALEAAGKEVVALDISPGAVEVCRRRGVTQTILGSVEDLAASRPQPFDTFIGIGNNLGLLASPRRAISFLDALRAMSTPASVLVGTMLDPYVGEDPVHLDYHLANREAGRLGGEVRLRVRSGRLATAWFSLLWASRDELAQVASSASWSLVETTPGAIYAAVLRPEPL